MIDSLWTIPLLFLAGTAAGLIDSIAGGGGLITLPVLLGIGLPPQAALGTNKFQSSFGSFTATAYHVHKKNIQLSSAWLGVLCTLVGAALGAWAVQQVDAKALGKIIPFMLMGILIYTFLTPKLGDQDQEPKLALNTFHIIGGISFGFYDGFFGPGVGSHFYTYEERGGTKLSSESLGVPEHNVINLARFFRVKTISPCDPNTANKHTGYIMTSAKRWM